MSKGTWAVIFIMVVVVIGALGWHSYHQEHPCIADGISNSNYTIETAPPKPLYVPERNDYVCPKGWQPGGGWKENGVPLDPYRGVTCVPLQKERLMDECVDQHGNDIPCDGPCPEGQMCTGRLRHP